MGGKEGREREEGRGGRGGREGREREEGRGGRGRREGREREEGRGGKGEGGREGRRKYITYTCIVDMYSDIIVQKIAAKCLRPHPSHFLLCSGK